MTLDIFSFIYSRVDLSVREQFELNVETGSDATCKECIIFDSHTNSDLQATSYSWNSGLTHHTPQYYTAQFYGLYNESLILSKQRCSFDFRFIKYF